MKLGINVAAVLAVIVGTLWTLQGANVIGGSFMSGQSPWLFIGLAMVVAGIAAMLWINLAG